jgi:hypothetical protein
MIGAAELAKGMVVRVEGQIYRVLEVDARLHASSVLRTVVPRECAAGGCMTQR